MWELRQKRYDSPLKIWRARGELSDLIATIHPLFDGSAMRNALIIQQAPAMVDLLKALRETATRETGGQSIVSEINAVLAPIENK